ncbi:hypothetical protein M3Y98_01016400 [Aphelenchoides besseyi]|nr:hypothetical protein M3Y98_01016400 [Aphelenchoides besseyi]KAI6210112.1 hypothetical protein M3Y96_00293100 [Aphelenchoides besseyi]
MRSTRLIAITTKRLTCSSRNTNQRLSICTSLLRTNGFNSRTCFLQNSRQPLLSYTQFRLIHEYESSLKSERTANQSAEEDDEIEMFVEDDLIEEEVEMEETDDVVRNRPPASEVRPEEIVRVLEEHRAKNIEVVDFNATQSPVRYLVIASPFNKRHADALTEAVRSHFCKHYYFGPTNPQKIKTTSGWYILDLFNTTIHVMREDLREKYDLAKVWQLSEQDHDQASWLQIDDHLLPPVKEVVDDRK